MKRNRDALSLSLLLMLAVVLVGGIVVLWQIPPEDADYLFLESGELLRVYSLDPRTPVASFMVPPSGSTVRDELSMITERLSVDTFRGLPIQILGVGPIDGVTRAVVNLARSQESAVDWQNTYFQGSAMAGETERAILWSLLQPEYEGPWIDRVEIYHDGEPFQPFDHIDLGGIYQRQDFIDLLAVSGSPGR